MEIKFEDVSFIIDKGTPIEKTILSHINFTICNNGIYSFLGNSNSGKTCIAELCDALIIPTSGRIIIDDYILDGRKQKNINKLRFNIGYVFKNPFDMFFKKTVKEELSFGIKYFKYKKEKIKFRIQDALKLVGLDELYLDRKISSLNLSEAKRVALASVLVFNPKVIILDEITIGMSYKEKKELSKLLKVMNKKYNKTIILLSRDTSFVYENSNYIYLMNRSRIIKEGNIDIFENTSLIEALGLDTPDIIKFVKLSNSAKNKHLRFCKDPKDLIKEVCKNVF